MKKIHEQKFSTTNRSLVLHLEVLTMTLNKTSTSGNKLLLWCINFQQKLVQGGSFVCQPKIYPCSFKTHHHHHCNHFSCRQGPRLGIRIDIWILPSDTIRGQGDGNAIYSHVLSAAGSFIITLSICNHTRAVLSNTIQF